MVALVVVGLKGGRQEVGRLLWRRLQGLVGRDQLTGVHNNVAPFRDLKSLIPESSLCGVLLSPTLHGGEQGELSSLG